MEGASPVGCRVLAGVACCLGGCYLSHPGIADEPDARDAVVPDDAATATDAAATDRSDAGDDGGDRWPDHADDRWPGDGEDRRSDDGRDADAAEAPCWDLDDDGCFAVECGGDDCDDGDPAVHPGAPDACADGVDADCDGSDPVDWLSEGLLLLDGIPPVVTGGLHTTLLWTGGDYAFVWWMTDTEGTWLVRLDAEGRRLGAPVELGPLQHGFEVVAAAGRLAAVWNDREDEPEAPSIWFQSWDLAGRPLLEEAVRISDVRDWPDEASGPYEARIAAAGDEFFVLWKEYDAASDVTTARLTRVGWDGTRRFEPLAATAGPHAGDWAVRLDSTGAEAGVVWRTSVHLPLPLRTSLWFQRVGWSGELLGEAVRLTDSATHRARFEVLWTGSEHAVFWNEQVGDAESAAFVRLDAAGEEVRRAALSPPLVGRFPPAQRSVVWSGRWFGVVWREEPSPGEYRVAVYRFGPSGEPLGSLLAAAAGYPPGLADVAWTGSELGFIWTEGGSSFWEPDYRVWFYRATFCD